jgi:4-amino-4-deoxy-L-arabinose transferase-like glycosyltransferase
VSKAVVLLIGVTAVLYGWDLGRTPVYLGGDEAHFGVEAYAIAHSGRDLNGRVMPLLFNLSDPLAAPIDATRTRWYQPALFYLIAIVLRFAPLTEVSVRAPVALIAGVLNPLLMYAVGMRLFRDRRYAALAAAILVLSPPHLILGRQALDYICPLPFLLGWLWCLLAAVDTDSVMLSLAAGLLLGIGFYSYLASWMMMPLFLVVTWIAQYRWGRRRVPSAMAAALGFVLPVLPLVPWLWAHPEMLRDTFGRYQVTSGHTLPRLHQVAEKIAEYWDYFDPSFLFLSGGLSTTTSTGRSGVFLLPVAVFLPFGIYELIRRRPSLPVGAVLLAGLAAAPIPATLIGERYMVQRVLFMLPFGAFIATFGVLVQLRSPRPWTRRCAVLLLAAMPLQFAYVYRDYFTHYQRRSAFYYDPAAFRGVAESLIAAQPPDAAPTTYFSTQLDDVGAKWRFYTTKHHREELLRRTRYFDEVGELGGAAHGSFAVLYAQDPSVPGLLHAGQWTLVSTVSDIDDRRASVILRRNIEDDPR